MSNDDRIRALVIDEFFRKQAQDDIEAAEELIYRAYSKLKRNKNEDNLKRAELLLPLLDAIDEAIENVRRDLPLPDSYSNELDQGRTVVSD